MANEWAELPASLAQLGSMTPAARRALRERLVAALAAPSLRVRVLAADGLGRVGDEECLVPLLHALHDPAPLVQWRAAHALQALHRHGLVSEERLVFQDGQAFQRWKRARLDQLAGQLRDLDPLIRADAVYSLGQIGDVASVSVVAPALADDDSRVREEASGALLALVGDTPDRYSLIQGAVLPLTHHGDPDLRGAAVRLVGRLGSRAAVGDLVPLLHDPDPDVRAEVCRALEGIGDPAGVGPLISQLADDDTRVRHAAARALGRLRDPRAVAPLALLLTDEHPPVRQAVIAALTRIGGEAATAGLIQALADPTPANRLAAIRALAQSGDAAALKPLAALARDRAVVDGVTLGPAAGAARRAIAGRTGWR